MLNQLKNNNERYFCSKCELYHHRKVKGKESKIYKSHLEFKIQVNESKIFVNKLLKSFRNYTIDSHKKSHKSKKQ